MRACKFISIFAILLILIAVIPVNSLIANDKDIIFKTSNITESSLDLIVRVPANTHTFLESKYSIPLEIKSETAELIINKVELPAGEIYEGDKVLRGSNNNYKDYIIKIFFSAPKYLKSKAVSVKYQLCYEDTKLCKPPKTVSINFLQTTPDKKNNIDSDKDKNNDIELNNLLENFTISFPASGYMKSGEMINYIEDVESGKKSASAPTGILMILFIILGGIALNLTPCVLPMIPINIAIIGAGSAAESRNRGFMIGGIYGLGITITYGALGLIGVLTGATFGAINSTPVFNFIIAAVFVLLSLAMFDIIIIDFSRFRSGTTDTSKIKGNLIAIFSMGCIAALLAGACVAPVLLFVLVQSANLYAEGFFAALLLPFLLGFGMGLPWPFIGAGFSFLPKPGKWMEYIKYVFGIFIIIMAGYYAFTGFKLLKPKSKTTIPIQKNIIKWETDLKSGLLIAKKNKKPVFLDFTASWCKNCVVMDKTTFRDPEVINKLDKYIKIKYKAEFPGNEPTKSVLKYFGVKGLPTYLILKPKPEYQN